MPIAFLHARIPAAVARTVLIRIAIAILAALPAVARQREAARGGEFDARIRPLLQEYCLSCHSTEEQKGDLDLEQFSSASSVRREPQLWQLVLEKLRNGEMPPAEKPQPNPEQREKLRAWIDGTLDDIARENAGDPGRS